MKNTTRIGIAPIVRAVTFMALLCGMVFLGVPFALAAFGEDVEKPRPVFTRDGAAVDARLLPRGKSTSVTVRFTANGAVLADVQSADFASVKTEGIDRKDFRCDLFVLTMGNLPVGGQAAVSVRSDFFSSSTRFLVYSPQGSLAWNDVQAEHKALPDRVREMTFTVTDGGPLDADGAADGRILLTGGPSDSFWGYAVGTLFIRFFGVFLVLGVLMIGMLVCGKLFEAADRRKVASAVAASPPSRPAATVQVPATAGEPEIEPEMAAAIALALHMEMSGPVLECDTLTDGGPSAWGLYGRQKSMSDRLQVFKRHSHSI
ncbi:MAG: OadG family protein [Thermodesulfobacteriota bacterium]